MKAPLPYGRGAFTCATWGVRDTDEEAAIMVRGRATEAEAVAAAKDDIAGFARALRHAT